MLWITVLIGLVLAALATWFVVLPLFDPQPQLIIDEDGPLADLLQRKETLLLSIKELEFDYQTGKLSSEDYQRLDQRARHQAIALLRQIEKAIPDSANLEAELEAAIRRQRKAVEAVAPAESAPTCPRCATALRASDNFCPKCGLALTAAPVSVA